MKNYLISLCALTLSTITSYGDSFSPEQETQSVVVEQSFEEQLQECRTELAQKAQNNPTVLEAFDLFSTHLSKAYVQEKSLSRSEAAQILTGVTFAAEKHKQQTRKDKGKTPYIVHPIGVATHLMQIGQVRDSAILTAALLHDTVEDTKTSFTEIEQTFGAETAGYVQEVTDDKTLSSSERKRRQVINAAHKSAGAAQIKLADKLYNLNDLFYHPPSDWSRSRIDQYYQWATSVIDRLPPANVSLKKALDERIQQYWEMQAEPKSVQ